METKTEWVIEEWKLRERVGCARAKLIKQRKEAIENVHWYRIESSGTANGPVVWTQEGLEWLKSRLGDWEDGEEPKKDEKAPEGVFGVIRQMPKNSKLLICEVRGQSMKVLTRDQRLFKVGMLIPLKELTGGILAVAKYPKANGKY